jgi:hypothetical protein
MIKICVVCKKDFKITFNKTMSEKIKTWGHNLTKKGIIFQ